MRPLLMFNTWRRRKGPNCYGNYTSQVCYFPYLRIPWMLLFGTEALRTKRDYLLFFPQEALVFHKVRFTHEIRKQQSRVTGVFFQKVFRKNLRAKEVVCLASRLRRRLKLVFCAYCHVLSNLFSNFFTSLSTPTLNVYYCSRVCG